MRTERSAKCAAQAAPNLANMARTRPTHNKNKTETYVKMIKKK